MNIQNLAASYKWTSWVWEINNWSLWLWDNWQPFKRNFWNIPQIKKKKTRRCQHITCWTWEKLDLDRLCSKPSSRLGGIIPGGQSWRTWQLEWWLLRVNAKISPQARALQCGIEVAEHVLTYWLWYEGCHSRLHEIILAWHRNLEGNN